MEWFLVAAALACNPGDRLIDLSSKIPRGLKSMDFVVSVEPFYARFYIYQPGFPDSMQHCCANKRTSVIKVPIVDGRFCVRQSQPQMKWQVRALLRPDIEMYPREREPAYAIKRPGENERCTRVASCKKTADAAKANERGHELRRPYTPKLCRIWRNIATVTSV